MIFSQTMELEVNLHNKTFICLILLNFRIPWQFKFIFVYLFFQNDIFEIEKHLKKSICTNVLMRRMAVKL